MNEELPIVNIVVILFTAIFTYRGFQNPQLIDKYLFDTERIKQYGEYYRIISSAFLHANWTHLLFNMFSLYSFGQYIEQYYSPTMFLLIYFISLAGGSLLSYYLHRNEPYRALGASGAVSGILFASIFLFPGGNVQILFFPMPVPSWLYAVMFVLISIYGIQKDSGSIGHDAHLGGAIIGLLTTAVIVPEIVVASPLLFLSVLFLTTAFFIYLLKRRSRWQ